MYRAEIPVTSHILRSPSQQCSSRSMVQCGPGSACKYCSIYMYVCSICTYLRYIGLLQCPGSWVVNWEAVSSEMPAWKSNRTMLCKCRCASWSRDGDPPLLDYLCAHPTFQTRIYLCLAKQMICTIRICKRTPQYHGTSMSMAHQRWILSVLIHEGTPKRSKLCWARKESVY